MILAFTILLVVAVRVRLRETPLERDEGEYAYAGQLILSGVAPHAGAYTMKLPGTCTAYALFMALLGQTPSAIHLGLAAVNVVSILLVFFLGRRLVDETAGLAAAVTFAFMSLSPSVLGLAGHATHFVVAFALAGFLVLLRVPESSKLAPLFISGVLLGLAFLMKQHGALFGLCGGIYILWAGLRHKRVNPKALAGRVIVFAAGVLLPFSVTCGIMWKAGVFDKFWFWTFTYSAKYAAIVPRGYGAQLFREGLNAVIGPDLLFWLLPWVGAVLIWWHESAGRARFFLSLLTICSAVSVCVGFFFRGHYFILLLPAMALLTGVAVSRAVHLLRHDRSIELFTTLPILGAFLLACVTALVGNGECWFGLSPSQFVRNNYRSSLFGDAISAGEYLKANSKADARVAILGSEPEILFYARRSAATGYIYMYPVMETHSYAGKMQDDMIREIETSRPEFVVFVDDPDSWLPQPGSHRQLLKWWEDYRDANLELVNTLKIARGLEPELGDSRGAGDLPSTILRIFRRKSAP